MAPLVAFCALLGLAIGSFLNVVIWRVPRGESVVSPPSACPGCHAPISPRDNIPVLSWLLLRGRCRSCGEPISARYPLVELLTAVVFGLLALRFGYTWQLPAYLYLGAIGVALAFIDLDTKRLPDRLTLPSYPVALILLGAAAFLDHTWDSWLRAILGGLAVGAFYFLLWFVYPSGMGFGDVKFAGVLGIYLGWISWGTVGGVAASGRQAPSTNEPYQSITGCPHRTMARAPTIMNGPKGMPVLRVARFAIRRIAPTTPPRRNPRNTPAATVAQEIHPR